MTVKSTTNSILERAEAQGAPAPEPEAKPVDAIASAGEMMRRFADGLYCVSKIENQIHDDDQLRYDDNRAFLIASQIYALAREVRSLREVMEAHRYA